MQLQRVVSWLAQHNFPHGLVSFADGFTTDPLRHKAEYLRNLKQDQEVVFHAAYGSAKDIAVYAGLGLHPDQIYIVGKASKKQANQATVSVNRQCLSLSIVCCPKVLAEGYAEHLACLTAHGGSRPAQGNARMVIPKSRCVLCHRPISTLTFLTAVVAASACPVKAIPASSEGAPCAVRRPALPPPRPSAPPASP